MGGTAQRRQHRGQPARLDPGRPGRRPSCHRPKISCWRLARTVLGRNGSTEENGGVALDYVYSGISVGNDDDELLLLAPGDREVDRVVWGRQRCRRGVRTQHAAATRWRGLGRFHHPMARFCRRHGHAGDGIPLPPRPHPTPLPGRNP
ncbi:MAG: hypothetical protein R2838_05900 [Caldilineaceae bacterium]